MMLGFDINITFGSDISMMLGFCRQPDFHFQLKYKVSLTLGSKQRYIDVRLPAVESLNVTWTILTMSLLHFWALNISVVLLAGSLMLWDYHQKYLNLCPEDK